MILVYKYNNWVVGWFDFTLKSIAMVMLGWYVHITTLFLLASLTKQLTSILCTYFRLKTSCISRSEENGRRNYFMINLHESMVPDLDRTLMVGVLKFQTLVTCKKGKDKQHRTKSDCF